MTFRSDGHQTTGGGGGGSTTATPLSPWQAAIKTLVAGGLSPGDNISHRHMYELLELVQPKASDRHGEAKKVELEYAHYMGRLKYVLREEHLLDVVNVHARGWVVLSAEGQLIAATADVRKGVVKLLLRAGHRLTHMDKEKLPRSLLKERQDTLLYLQQIKRMVRKKIWIV